MISCTAVQIPGKSADMVRVPKMRHARFLKDSHITARGQGAWGIADLQFCPGGQRQRLTVNKSTLLV